MKTENRLIGKITENIAASYLVKKGMNIIEQNFQNKFGEIDIIAKDREVLVFVEVKAKTGTKFGIPEEMVTKKKLCQVKRMANLYIQQIKIPCRIDVVAIVLNKQKQPIRLTHYQNVY